MDDFVCIARAPSVWSCNGIAGGLFISRVPDCFIDDSTTLVSIIRSNSAPKPLFSGISLRCPLSPENVNFGSATNWLVCSVVCVNGFTGVRRDRGKFAPGETATDDVLRREGTENMDLGDPWDPGDLATSGSLALMAERERSSSTSRKMRSDLVPVLGRSRF